MNNKLLKAAIAGAATLTIAATTTTFAAWSDWDSITNNNVGADELSLVLSEPNTQNFDNLKLAPGVDADYEFVVANRTGETVPTASLTATLSNLVGEEDGCTSVSSEKAADNNCDNGNPNNPGEFIDEAVITYTVSKVLSEGDAGYGAPCTAPRGWVGATGYKIPLSQIEGDGIDVLNGDYLGPDDKVCVAMGIAMPKEATNASQGDSATFDIDFLLEQEFVTPTV